MSGAWIQTPLQIQDKHKHIELKIKPLKNTEIPKVAKNSEAPETSDSTETLLSRSILGIWIPAISPILPAQ